MHVSMHTNMFASTRIQICMYMYAHIHTTNKTQRVSKAQQDMLVLAMKHITLHLIKYTIYHI